MKLAISLFILFSITLVSAISPGQDLIQEVCAQSNNKPICVASLESNPDSHNATLQQLENRHFFADKNPLDMTLLEPTVEQALRDCYEQYLDAIEQLDDSLAALLANANVDVQTWVNAAIAVVDSCEEGFKGNDKVHVSSRNAMFKDLCNNVLV